MSAELSAPFAYKQKHANGKSDKADDVLLARVLQLDVHYLHFDVVKDVAFILDFV